MNGTWRNEWRWNERARTALRWGMWSVALFFGGYVLATVVQRLTQ